MKRTFLVIETEKFELEDGYSLDNFTPNQRLEFNNTIYTITKIVPRLEKIGNQVFTTVDIFLE